MIYTEDSLVQLGYTPADLAWSTTEQYQTQHRWLYESVHEKATGCRGPHPQSLDLSGCFLALQFFITCIHGHAMVRIVWSYI